MLMPLVAALLQAAAPATAEAPVPAEAIAACDRAASHPADPMRVAPGRNRPDIDLDAAIATCQAALDASPGHARSSYHLGRVLFYSGRSDEAMVHLNRSSEAGYPQATFVLGYLASLDTSEPDNMCVAAQLWRKSIRHDHPWTGYHLVESSLAGGLAKCEWQPSAADLARYMAIARDHITISASAGRVEALHERYEQGVD